MKSLEPAQAENDALQYLNLPQKERTIQKDKKLTIECLGEFSFPNQSKYKSIPEITPYFKSITKCPVRCITDLPEVAEMQAYMNLSGEISIEKITMGTLKTTPQSPTPTETLRSEIAPEKVEATSVNLTHEIVREKIGKIYRQNSDSQNSQSDSGESIKQQVWNLLDKNPLLMPKQICTILHLYYQKHGDYVNQLKTKWKYDFKNRQGLKCLKFHNWRGFIYVPTSVDRSQAPSVGWRVTKARNHMFMWKDDTLMT